MLSVSTLMLSIFTFMHSVFTLMLSVFIFMHSIFTLMLSPIPLAPLPETIRETFPTP